MCKVACVPRWFYNIRKHRLKLIGYWICFNRVTQSYVGLITQKSFNGKLNSFDLQKDEKKHEINQQTSLDFQRPSMKVKK